MLEMRLSKAERIRVRECTCFSLNQLLTILKKSSKAEPGNAVYIARCIHYLRHARGPVNKRVAYDSLKALISGMFGRRQRRGQVAYTPQTPIWFRNLIWVLNIDKGLTVTTVDEIDRIEREEEKACVLDMLKSPWVIGHAGRKTGHDVTHREQAERQRDACIHRLRELGMTREEINSFIVKRRRSARIKVRSILNEQLRSWRERMGLGIAMTLAGTANQRRIVLFTLSQQFREVEETRTALERQSRILGLTTPRMPWIVKYRTQIKEISSSRTRTGKTGGNR